MFLANLQTFSGWKYFIILHSKQIFPLSLQGNNLSIRLCLNIYFRIKAFTGWTGTQRYPWRIVLQQEVETFPWPVVRSEFLVFFCIMFLELRHSSLFSAYHLLLIGNILIHKGLVGKKAGLWSRIWRTRQFSAYVSGQIIRIKWGWEPSLNKRRMRILWIASTAPKSSQILSYIQLGEARLCGTRCGHKDRCFNELETLWIWIQVTVLILSDELRESQRCSGSWEKTW